MQAQRDEAENNLAEEEGAVVEQHGIDELQAHGINVRYDDD